MKTDSEKFQNSSFPVRHTSVLAVERLYQASALVLRGVFLNACMAILKIVSGILGNSYALIADGMESSIDVASSVITWHGIRLAATPPDEEHPYGHGKAEPLAAVLISIFVLGAALLIAGLSVREIFVRHHNPEPFTLGVLLLVIVAKEILYRVMRRKGQQTGSGALIADAFHHRSDALTSLAAFVGISVALIGGPGFESADDCAALLACGFIAWNAWKRLHPALNEIMDSAPDPQVEISARKAAANVAGVLSLDQSRVRKMGLEYFVDLHVVVDAAMNVEQGHRIAHAVRDAIISDNGLVTDVLVHIEPQEAHSN